MPDSTGPPRLKVMFDWSAFPLWTVPSGRHDSAMVSPESLSLSRELVEALLAWAAVGEAQDIEDDTVVDEEWNRRGRDLAEQVGAELESRYVVGYFDEVLDRVVWPPFA